MSNTTTRPGKLRSCSCRLFEAGRRVDVAGGDVDFIDVVTTGCKASTTRLFAQGHDAKLVSFLVAAEMDGLEIALVDQGSSWARAEDAARTISDALAVKAADMVRGAVAKAVAKAARDKGKAEVKARKAAVKELVRPVTKTEVEVAMIPPATRASDIKVGRWIYKNATIDPTTGTATYSTKLGSLKTAPAGTFAEV